MKKNSNRWAVSELSRNKKAVSRKVRYSIVQSMFNPYTIAFVNFK
jgi:hypothetical protein